MESRMLDAGGTSVALVEAGSLWRPIGGVEGEGRMPDAAGRNAELMEYEGDRWKREWEVECWTLDVGVMSW